VSELNAREARFVEEYLVDLNATQAAIRAGYSERTADQQGSRLLKKVKVREEIRARQVKRSEKVEITAAKVLERWVEIAFADPNELIEYRRSCCRYCWGKDHRWQETPSEQAHRRDVHATEERAFKRDPKDNPDPGEFSERGGLGWDPRKDPHPDCPECFGEGQERPFAKDTRKLSPAGAALYSGVKITRDGMQVLMQDQGAALAKVAQHLGMLKERHEHSGPNGGPIETTDLVDALAGFTPAEREQVRALASKMEAAKAAGKGES
jgi:phage terminase small subunit